MSLMNVIIELGSCFIRGGIANESSPRFELNITNLHPQIYHNQRNQKDVMGTNRQRHLNGLDESRQYLMLLEIMSMLFIQHLALKPKDCSVIVVEYLLETKMYRDCLLSVLLRDLQVASVSFQPDIIMPMLAMGSSSGLVVDIGEVETRCLAIVHGRPILSTLQVGNIGVRHAVSVFSNKLSAHLQVKVDDIAAKKLFLKFSYFDSASDATGDDPVLLASLPFAIPADVRCCGAQFLATGFDAAFDDGNEYASVVELVLRCLKSCSMAYRATVVGSVVVAGGGSKIRGLPRGLCLAVERAAAADDTYKDVAACLGACREQGRPIGPLSTAFDRSHLAWIGGSLFGALNKDTSKFISLQSATRRPDEIVDSASAVPQSIAGGNAVGSGPIPANRRLKCSASFIAPDWMSTDHGDWAFFGPHPSP